MRRLGLLLFSIFFCLCLYAQNGAQKYVQSLAAKEPFISSVWGVQAVKMDGEVVLSYNEKQKMVPASNIKLVTTAAALKAFGGDFCYETVFASDTTVVDGVLQGDLFIVGSGDPSTSEEAFPGWLAALKAVGINSIAGSIIGDARYFTADGHHEDWSYGDYESEDASPVAGLNYNHNYRDTTYSLGIGASGAFNCAYYFHKYLNDNDLPVLGGFGDDKTFSDSLPPQESLLRLAACKSDPLRDLIKHTNTKSDNFYAEALLRKLGAERRGDDSYEASIEEEIDVLHLLGVDTSVGLTICDGSGLARRNYASPEFFTRFLALMADSSYAKDFMGSLPHPGEGTVVSVLPRLSSQDKRRIRLKSGSMGAVRCFSGYIEPRTGGNPDDRIVFSIITNNNTAPKGTVLNYIEQIIAQIAACN